MIDGTVTKISNLILSVPRRGIERIGPSELKLYKLRTEKAYIQGEVRVLNKSTI